MKERSIMKWGALWRSKNKLDGVHEHLIRDNTLPALFHTRREAHAFIKREFGYLRGRKDLQAEPHGWKVPTAVRVKLTVQR